MTRRDTGGAMPFKAAREDRGGEGKVWMAAAGLVMVAALAPLIIFFILRHCAAKLKAEWTTAGNEEMWICGTYGLRKQAAAKAVAAGPRGTPPTPGLSAAAGGVAPAGKLAPARTPAPSTAPSAGTEEAPSLPPKPARYAGRKAAQWAALQRAGWRCQLCGCAGILEVYRAGEETDGGMYALENLFALCRACHPRRGELKTRGTVPVPFAPSAEAGPRFEDVSGRTVEIDLDQLDTVSRGGGHGARTTVRYRPRRGGACFLLTSGYPFVCREIDRALVARNLPRLRPCPADAEPPGECLPPEDREGAAQPHDPQGATEQI